MYFNAIENSILREAVKERIFVKVARDLIFAFKKLLFIFNYFPLFSNFLSSEFSEILCGNVKYCRAKFINYFHARFYRLKYPFDKPRSIYYIAENVHNP